MKKRENVSWIQAQIDDLALQGGKVQLLSGEYELDRTLIMDTSSLGLFGEIWSCNTDPNGVFESRHGTKLHMRGKDFPALAMGRHASPISGAMVRDLGIQGDIRGMDTRPITDFSAPEKSAGICLDSMRTDQCEFSKISCCGLSNAVCATGNAEIDACLFEKINADGCGNGFYFAPRASYYTRVRACIIADNPYYGFYADGKNRQIHNLEIFDCHFVRNAGAFTQEDGLIPAAVLFDHISHCAVSHNIFDAPGTFWYFDEDATENNQRQPFYGKAVALYVIGNENRIRDNTFLHSSDDSIRVEGDGNVLLSNIADGSVRIRGTGNTVANLIFTRSEARLILEKEAKNTTTVIGVPEEKIIRI